MVDPNSSSGFLMNRDGITPRYTSYYKPRGAVNVTETEKRDNKGETTTQVVTKYQVGPQMGKSGFEVTGYGPRDEKTLRELDSSVTSELYNPTPYNPRAIDRHPIYSGAFNSPFKRRGYSGAPPPPFKRHGYSGAPPSPIPYNPGGVDRHPIYSGAFNYEPMSLSTQQLRHPLYDHSPFLSAQQHFPWPALRPRRIEDEGREEEVWEFYKKLREEGYSVVEAAQATAIFFSRGDAPAGLLERAN